LGALWCFGALSFGGFELFAGRDSFCGRAFSLRGVLSFRAGGVNDRLAALARFASAGVARASRGETAGA
jgi:hypothetical protein